MKIAIFGKSGQLARELQRRAGETLDLQVFDRASADFLNPDQLLDVARALNVDAVINATAYTQVDLAETDEDRAHTINATSVGVLARVCADKAIPLVHVSTDYVFSGEGTAPWRPQDPVDPRTVYGKTKLAGEQEIALSECQGTVLRTSWVFSAFRSNFVKTMLKLAEDHSELKIVSDQVGGPTAAADIADACFTIAADMVNGAPGGTYHFSGREDVSWAGFAREIFQQSGRGPSIIEVPTTDFPRPAPRPLNSRLDCSTLEADFGIVRPDWRVGLKDVLEELAIQSV